MNRILGIVVTLALSLAVVFAFWGEPLRNPNQTFFASSGDGLKDYFTTTYLVKHDTSYWHSNVMNYPFGENVMYTGCQPSVSHIVKLVSEHIVDISDYTVGIINMIMIVSLILGSLFLYLLLVHFKLPWLYSALVAIGITFLSPQIARMGGHYSLSYVFAIPLILYLTATFHQKPRIATSVILGLFMLWAVGTHVYMLGFYAFIILIYWIINAFYLKTISFQKGILHFAIQFIAPFAIFLLAVLVTSKVTDRTSEPWGFLVFVTRPESFLLPLGRPYAKFIYHFSDFRYIEWESIAFVGMVAAVGFLTLLTIAIHKLLRKQFVQTLWPKQNPDILNVFLWVSAISLFYSFGFPFKLGLPWLVDYIGPLKQMRGLARFSWIFYYVLNIYVFYKIWHLKFKPIKKYLWYLLVGASLSMLWYDAWYNTSFWSKFLNNSVPALTDRDSELPVNQWIDVVDVDRYQAILPIPYFHIGSENIWVDNQNGINAAAFTVSWKTGLPSMGVLMSRTSIAQTLANLQLVWEPYRMPGVLQKIDPQKDILILAKEADTEIPQQQFNLIKKSIPIYRSDDFNLYALPFDSLVSVFANLYEQELHDFESRELFTHGEYLSTSRSEDFVVETFAEDTPDALMIGSGGKSQRFKPNRMFWETAVPSVEPDADYVLSFWVQGAHIDLMLRSQLVVEVTDSLGTNYFYGSTALSKLVKTIDGDWVLVEVNVNIRNCGDKLGFWLKNQELRREYYTVNHILVRPEYTDVYQKTERWLLRNNRFYLK